MTAISIHVGINKVSKSLFPNAVELLGPENDADEMSRIAKANGFEVRELFKGLNATFKNVEDAILKVAAELKNDGDIFLFTFAGHGSRQADEENEENEEEDLFDETILLFDRILVDDYLRSALWSEFKPGVRIIGVADCCHSGTSFLSDPMMPAAHAPTLFPQPGYVKTMKAKPVLSAAGSSSFAVGPGRTKRSGRNRVLEEPVISRPLSGRLAAKPRFREITDQEREEHLQANPELYNDIEAKLAASQNKPIQASLLTLAACLDGETTPDGDEHGLFTQSLINVLKGNPVPASYDALKEGIQTEYQRVGRQQTPVLNVKGTLPNFNAQRPFSIAP